MNAKIVVVDDDQEIRELLDEYLSKSGYHVTIVEDGLALKSVKWPAQIHHFW